MTQSAGVAISVSGYYNISFMKSFFALFVVLLSRIAFYKKAKVKFQHL